MLDDAEVLICAGSQRAGRKGSALTGTQRELRKKGVDLLGYIRAEARRAAKASAPPAAPNPAPPLAPPAARAAAAEVSGLQTHPSFALGKGPSALKRARVEPAAKFASESVAAPHRARRRKDPGAATCTCVGGSCTVWELDDDGLYPNPVPAATKSRLAERGFEVKNGVRGRGIFATRDLPRGTLVAPFIGIETAHFPFAHPYVLQIGERSIIPLPCCEISYANHGVGFELNAQLTMGGFSGRQVLPSLVSTRDLKKGEEVLWDYSGKGVSAAHHFGGAALRLSEMRKVMGAVRVLVLAGITEQGYRAIKETM